MSQVTGSEKKAVEKVVGIIAIGAILAGVVMAGVQAGKQADRQAQSVSTTGTAPVVEASAAPVVPEGQKWRTFDSYDRMDNTTEESALLDASNRLDFAFPYDGGSTATLTVSRIRGSHDFTIGLTVDHGQFDPHGLIEAKFDDQPEQYWAVTESDSRKQLWLHRTEEVAGQLRTARHLTLRVRFYPAELRDIEFDVKDFPLVSQ